MPSCSRSRWIVGAVMSVTAGASGECQSTASADVERTTRMSIVIGASRANASGSLIGDGLWGGSLGVATNVRVSTWFGIRPELHVVQKGTREPNTDLGVARIRTSYVEVPVLARVNLPGGRAVRPFVELGPSVALNLQCDFSLGGRDLGCDRLGGIERVDYGASAGAGLVLRHRGRDWGLGVRYTAGLRDFTRDVSSQNRVTQIMVSIGL